ncbi:MAG: hydroxymethylpyrimidine/phosphomethylpyrimidine kinase [Polyangiaceae bacterium]|jgi:hydroxymethylpyrimidine/phosphomethylpyrimidine kinase
MVASWPCALAIGGLDPGGGAGIAADLRAFSAAGVFGCAAVAVITIQSTARLVRVRPVAARDVEDQIRHVLAHQRVEAVKVGALGTRSNVVAVARLLDKRTRVPVVVDTPMLPTRGTARLLAARAIAALRQELLPVATVLTVNVSEAEALLGESVRTVGEAHDAAVALERLGPRAVLVKGGHMTGAFATDVLAVDGEVVELRAPRLAPGEAHGTGCALASLIAGRLALDQHRPIGGASIIAAARWAKRVHHAALAGAVSVGRGLPVLRLGPPRGARRPA